MSPSPRVPNTATSPGTGSAHVPHDEIIPILDFGGQTVQLIARRVREAGCFSMLVSPTITAAELRAMNPKGIILSGGPSSVYDKGAPTCDPAIYELGIPILAICYGWQLTAKLLGGKIEGGGHREFGRAHLAMSDTKNAPVLFKGIPDKTTVWMSHGDSITAIPESFRTIAATPTSPFAAVHGKLKGGADLYGVLFHPEVTHTPHGSDLIRNFVFEVCRAKGTWKMSDFAEVAAARVREQVGKGQVICGLSGGVDSSVVAALLHKAIGDQLHCVFVDTGLLRSGERELVESTFRDHFKIDLHVVDAEKEFLADLAGVTDPQVKRKRIGHRFIEVFKAKAKDIGLGAFGGTGLPTGVPSKGKDSRHTGQETGATMNQATFLAQGTLYPDVIESGHGHSGQAAGIKLHHNVGGLPEDLGFQLVEPLRDLFKDEVRKLGAVLGLPDQLIWRHPFPGPGLAVRVLGEVTKPKLDVLRACDEILLEEIVANNLYRTTSQVFAVLLPVQSVGVMGDGRTYDNAVAVRAVETQDFMSADWSRIPYDVLATISNRIINEVRGVNRVVYDISSKPPATIEWE
ncbi:MAG TPA: glutamine-hydrolyzing GMP synthase [Phycisphaerales bacterium]|nr:glutamine-hydrolyzing GMP synthase [Phycisphaerales bacterium]